MQRNDAFYTVVQEDRIERARLAIVLLHHSVDPCANTGNWIVANQVVGPGAVGVSIGDRSRGNAIALNSFRSIRTDVEGAPRRNWISKNRSW